MMGWCSRRTPVAELVTLSTRDARISECREWRAVCRLGTKAGKDNGGGWLLALCNLGGNLVAVWERDTMVGRSDAVSAWNGPMCAAPWWTLCLGIAGIPSRCLAAN